jgi:hypothetical protein
MLFRTLDQIRIVDNAAVFLSRSKIEKSNIASSNIFFSTITSDQFRYDVLASYGQLMNLVK